MRCAAAVVAGVLVGSVSVPAHGQGRDTVEDQLRLGRRLLSESIEEVARERFRDCMAATGNASFCACLDRLPPLATFRDYIDIVTSAPQRRAELEPRLLALAEGVETVRARCAPEIERR